MIKEFIKRYQYIIYIGLSLGILDLYIRFINRGLGSIRYFDLAPILFTISWIFFFTAIITLLNGRLKKIIYAGLILVFNLLLFTNYIFLKIFSTFFSFNNLSMADEGKGYLGMILNYISLPLILIILISLFLSIIGLKAIPQNRIKKDIVIGFLLLFIAISSFSGARLFLGKAADASSWDTWLYKRNVYNTFSDSRRSLQVSGFFEYTIRDLYLNTIAKKLKNNKEALLYLKEYYAETAPENPSGKFSKIFKNKNVIVILMESTDNWIVTEERMPTLYNIMNEGLNFTNHYSPIYGSGATFNSEFMLNTGYMTPFNEEIASNQYGSNTFSYSLANLFKKKAYTINYFHENIGSFYNRGQMTKTMGYPKYNSSIENGIKYEDAIKDTHFMKVDEIRDMIIPDKGKFMSFITTYTLHGPYETDTSSGAQCTLTINKTEKLAIKKGGNEEEICLNAQAREADNFFKLLLKELKAKGKLDNTVIVGVADHYAYGYTDMETLYKLKGTKDSNLIGEVPFFIWSNDLKPKEITNVSSNIDILPTIADLFGLNYNSKNYIGENILSDDYQGYVFFKDYSWYDGTTYYKNGQLVQGEDVSKKYINEMNKKVNESLKFNKYILDTDYFSKHQTKQLINKGD